MKNVLFVLSLLLVSVSSAHAQFGEGTNGLGLDMAREIKVTYRTNDSRFIKVTYKPAKMEEVSPKDFTLYSSFKEIKVTYRGGAEDVRAIKVTYRPAEVEELSNKLGLELEKAGEVQELKGQD